MTLQSGFYRDKLVLMDKSKKILICDDDAGIVEVIKIVLEGNNYQVSSTSNGKGILKHVIDSKPDLVLLDLWMPGMDGREILKVLHRDPVTKNLPIVIMSALSDAKSIAEEIGATDCLPKPFDISVLLGIVKKYTT